VGEFFNLVFVGTGGALFVAGFLAAHAATQNGQSSLGLGIASAGFCLSGALCYWAAVWLATRPAAPAGEMAGNQRPAAEPDGAPSRGGGR
jgi:hypothetical protein